MAELEICLNLVICTEDGVFVAQALEYDIAAQGESVDEVLRRFEHILVAHVLKDLRLGQKPLAALGAAPPYYHERWKLARALQGRVPIAIPAVDDLSSLAIPPWMVKPSYEARVC